MFAGYRTIISASVALLGEILRQQGVEIDVAGITNSLMIIGGTIGAIYFRFIAKPKP